MTRRPDWLRGAVAGPMGADAVIARLDKGEG